MEVRSCSSSQVFRPSLGTFITLFRASSYHASSATSDGTSGEQALHKPAPCVDRVHSRTRAFPSSPNSQLAQVIRYIGCVYLSVVLSTCYT